MRAKWRRSLRDESQLRRLSPRLPSVCPIARLTKRMKEVTFMPKAISLASYDFTGSATLCRARKIASSTSRLSRSVPLAVHCIRGDGDLPRTILLAEPARQPRCRKDELLRSRECGKGKREPFQQGSVTRCGWDSGVEVPFGALASKTFAPGTGPNPRCSLHWEILLQRYTACQCLCQICFCFSVVGVCLCFRAKQDEL